MTTVAIEKAAPAVRELRSQADHDSVVLTSKGRPVTYIISAKKYDEYDIGFMAHPEFWKMIRERRKSDDGISLEQWEVELQAKKRAEKAAGNGGREKLQRRR
jgi:hypothetical protein